MPDPSPYLVIPGRSRVEAALDLAARALKRARRHIAEEIAANAPDAEPGRHSVVVELDRAIADIETLREGEKG